MSDETQRLLPDGPTSPSTPTPQPSNIPTWRKVTIFSLTCITLFMLQLAGTMEMTPLSEIMEKIVCRGYQGATYMQEPDTLDRCKQADVQAQVASIQAWRATIETIPGMALAIPYGMLADKYSQSLIMGLSIAGLGLYWAADALICAYAEVVSVKLLFLTPILTVVGGGDTVLSSVALSIVGDITTDSQRSTALSFIFSSLTLGKLVGAFLTYYAMEVDPWISIYVSLGIIGAAVPITLLIPAASSKPKAKPESVDFAPAESKSWTVKIRSALADSKPALRWMFVENTAASIVIATLILTSLGMYAKILEMQYLTKVFGVSWAEAGLILNWRTITQMILLLLLVPAASHLMTSRLHMSAAAKDLFLCRFSTVVNIAGALIFGCASSMSVIMVGIVVFAMGGAYQLAALSIVSFMAPAGKASTMYATVNVLMGMGVIVAAPAVAAFFKLGMRLGGAWIGLPYFVVAGTYVVTLVLLSFVRVDKRRGGDVELHDAAI